MSFPTPSISEPIRVPDNKEDSLKAPAKPSLSPSSGSPSRFSLLSKLNREEEQIAKMLPAAEFCVEAKEDAVKPSDYFFDALSPIVGKGHDAIRPRKFKKVTKNAKENADIQKLKERRKALQEELFRSSAARLPDSLLKLIISKAKDARPFDEIARHFSREDPLLSVMRAAYEKVSSCGHHCEISRSLDEVVDFDAMNHEEALLKAGYTKPEHKGKIDKDAWENRGRIAEQLKINWNDVPVASTPEKGAAQPMTILNYFLSQGPDIANWKSGKLFLTLKDAYKTTAVETKLLNAMLMIITKALQELDESQKNRAASAAFELEQKCSKDGPLYNLILVASQQLIDKERASPTPIKGIVPDITIGTSKEKIGCLSIVIKEQRQHSIARFYNLLNYYTAFVNTINLLGEIAEEIKPGSRNTVALVVVKILEKSWLELGDNPRAKAQGRSSSMTKEQIEKEITIISEAHRLVDIMGYEKSSFLDADRKLASDILNLFLDTVNSGDRILGFERAHTLPFPSCFAWKEGKERNFIQEAGELFSKDPESKPVHFNNIIFKAITHEVVPHSEIVQCFGEEFKNYKEKYREVSEFIYMSLETVRRFYLRLFSETEMMPDFVNIHFDGASEWRFSVEAHYKNALANSLINLVAKKSACKEEDVAEALIPYLAQTQEKVVSLYNSCSPEVNDSVFKLMKLVGLFQVEEALRTALLNRSTPATIEAIFQKTLVEV